MVAHAFRRHLVLDLDAGRAGSLDLPDRAHHVDRVAEADAAIDDERQPGTRRDAAGGFGEFREREEGLGDGEFVAERTTRQVAGREPQRLGEPGLQRGQAERRDHRGRAGQGFPQTP